MSDQLADVRSFGNFGVKRLINCLRLSVTQIILSPILITMTIAATRMHRYLVDFASGFPDVYDTPNLLYLLSYLTRAILFQCYRAGE
jgi:hypothetical protein